MRTQMEEAAYLHEKVPPDWYFDSIKRNLGQRFWHQRRFLEARRLIEPSGGSILDIGSADGVFTKVILEKSQANKVVGIDVLPSSVAWAQKHWRKYPKLSFQVGDAHKLDFKSKTFDAVFVMEVLEHVIDPEKVLSEISRVLKDGGYAVFLVPTDSILFKAIWFFWTKFGRGRIWDHTHIQSFQNGNLNKILERMGFKIEEERKFLLGMLQIIKVRKAKKT